MAVRPGVRCHHFHGWKNAINFWIDEFERVWKICTLCIRHFGSSQSFGWPGRLSGTTNWHSLRPKRANLIHRIHLLFSAVQNSGENWCTFVRWRNCISTFQSKRPPCPKRSSDLIWSTFKKHSGGNIMQIYCCPVSIPDDLHNANNNRTHFCVQLKCCNSLSQVMNLSSQYLFIYFRTLLIVIYFVI